MALMMTAPWVSSGVMFFAAALTLVALVAVHVDRISRTRVLWAAVVAVAFIYSVVLFADDGETVINACSNWEPWSWQWVAAGCWMLGIFG